MESEHANDFDNYGSVRELLVKSKPNDFGYAPGFADTLNTRDNKEEQVV